MKPITVDSATEWGDIRITSYDDKGTHVVLCQDAAEEGDEECIVVKLDRLPRLRVALRKVLNRLEEEDDDDT
jgi:hypothetical protein